MQQDIDLLVVFGDARLHHGSPAGLAGNVLAGTGLEPGFRIFLKDSQLGGDTGLGRGLFERLLETLALEPEGELGSADASSLGHSVIWMRS